MRVSIENSDLRQIADLVVEQLIARQSEIIPPAPAAPEKGQKIVGIRNVAKFLGCAPSKVQEMKNDGILPFYHIGNHKVFAYENELIEALRR